MAMILLGSLAFAQMGASAVPLPPAPALPPGARLARIADRNHAGASYLGVDIRDLAPERASQLGLKEVNGVEITMVDQDSPAGKAGLKEEDVIVSFNGRKIDNADQLRRVIHETPPGASVQLG